MGRNRRAGRIATFLLPVIVVTALASAAHGQAPKPDDADAALDNAIQQLMQSPSAPPGLISVIQRGDQIKVHAAGVADIATGVGPAPDDHMQIASASKAFSGAAALAVVEEGKLSLDDTIGKQLPNLPQAWKDVTLAQALQHRSGLPNFTAAEAWGTALTASPLTPPPMVELLSFVQDKPLDFKPGSKYHYSNSDNIVVALMIEAATGRPYTEVLQEKVYGPLGLAATSLPSDNLMPTPYIHGYLLQPPNPPEDNSQAAAFGGWLSAAGGMVSTPTYMNRFVRAYARGETTNKGTADRQFRFVKGNSEPKGPGANGAGLGIFRYKTRCGTVYGHTGNSPFGYTQFIGSTRNGARSATVSINSQLDPKVDPQAFAPLARVFEQAVCAALAGT